jgi:hypothetical protein
MNQFKIKKMRKVTIGFKGDPSLKLEVKAEAEESDMTTSEYLEAIVENRHMQEDVKMLRYRLRQAIQEKDNILEKLEQYEERLRPLFNKLKGQRLPYRDANGAQTQQTINHPIDILDGIISSLNKENNGTL